MKEILLTIQFEPKYFKKFIDYCHDIFYDHEKELENVKKLHNERMKKTKGGLLSFNNFLSISKDLNVSLRFARDALTNLDFAEILFVMTIDSSKSTIPFASIHGVSYFQDEEEVLFSMHTVFHIHDIKSMSENDIKDLSQLTECIRQETFPDSGGWCRLGITLQKMDQFKKSEQVYYILLDQTKAESEKAYIYHQLGVAKDKQGKYNEAIAYYKKSIEIEEKIVPHKGTNLAASHSTIGLVYFNMGEYSKALPHYEKSLAIKQQSLLSNHPTLTRSYNNIGIV